MTAIEKYCTVWIFQQPTHPGSKQVCLATSSLPTECLFTAIPSLLHHQCCSTSSFNDSTVAPEALTTVIGQPSECALTTLQYTTPVKNLLFVAGLKFLLCQAGRVLQYFQYERGYPCSYFRLKLEHEIIDCQNPQVLSRNVYHREPSTLNVLDHSP